MAADVIFGFSAAVNSYQAFGYDCDGSESSLRNCTRTGSSCTADSVNHAIAISCGSNDGMPLLSQSIETSVHVDKLLIILFCTQSQCFWICNSLFTWNVVI